MILPISTEPKPILHQTTDQIKEITPEIRQLALDMRETMHNAQGIGLAAPQVGKSISLLVFEVEDKEDPEYSIPFMGLINPRITWKSTQQEDMIEACLSIPGLEANVRRASKVRVKGQNLEGEVIQISADGLLARILQHEIDHLNGILFTSYVTKKQLKVRPLVDYPRI